MQVSISPSIQTDARALSVRYTIPVDAASDAPSYQPSCTHAGMLQWSPGNLYMTTFEYGAIHTQCIHIHRSTLPENDTKFLHPKSFR